MCATSLPACHPASQPANRTNTRTKPNRTYRENPVATLLMRPFCSGAYIPQRYSSSGIIRARHIQKRHASPMLDATPLCDARFPCEPTTIAGSRCGWCCALALCESTQTFARSAVCVFACYGSLRCGRLCYAPRIYYDAMC